MTNTIEDILVCIHDQPGHDEHTKLGRMVREVGAHLVPFGHYTATERVRIGGDSGPRTWDTVSHRIADMIHNTSRAHAQGRRRHHHRGIPPDGSTGCTSNQRRAGAVGGRCQRHR